MLSTLPFKLLLLACCLLGQSFLGAAPIVPPGVDDVAPTAHRVLTQCRELPGSIDCLVDQWTERRLTALVAALSPVIDPTVDQLLPARVLRQVTIDLSNEKKSVRSTVDLMDTEGDTIDSFTGSDRYDICMTDLPDGPYLLRIRRTDGSRTFRRLMKQ